MESPAPKPFLFNIWKHHFLFLLNEIRTSAAEVEPLALGSVIKKIGNSTTDLYTGPLSIPEISEFCKRQLILDSLFEKDTYIKWIRQHPESYREMIFPDRSVWILKIGVEKERHIHIHPGRNVLHTVRVKANILKTAYLANLFAYKYQKSPMDIELINSMRNDVLDLSPIKFVTMNHDLGKIIYLFGNNLGLFNKKK
jgi:hypothetical protein